MAYNKKTWVANELITAAGLNRMEQGIEDAYLRAENWLEENNEALINELRNNIITHYAFTIDVQNETLIFNIIENQNET